MAEAEKWASKAPIKEAVIEVRPIGEGADENIEAKQGGPEVAS